MPRAVFCLVLTTTLGFAGPAAAQADVAVPKFVDETGTSGVDSVFAGDWEYMVGGGVSTFDCDDDGFPDVLLPGGADPARFYRNVGARGAPLRFERQASGLELDAVAGSYPLDVDSDGRMDLILLRVGENVAMRGLGNCRFERANEAWAFEGGDAWSTALAATWERGANWPTIATGNYIDRNEEISPWGSCTDNWLHRPDGTARFAPPLPLNPSFCALSMLFTDWNRSGSPSLRVSNDREYYEGGQEQMWRIRPGEAPSLFGEADGWKRLRIWGMGIASYDLDGDLYPEYFLTSMADNKLQTLVAPGKDSGPVYKDVAFAAGVTAHRPYTGDDSKPSTAWHAEFDDVNNDGLVDLFVAKGNVAEMPDFAAVDPNNLLLQAPDGKFVEAGDRAGIATNGVSRGAALVDFNLDGLLDLVVVNRWKPAQVWRNASAPAGNWIQFRPRQPGANPDAVGSWIEVKRGDAVMRREITVGGGHAGGQSGWWHFGLDGEEEASVRLIWPDGESSEWSGLEANRFYILEREKPAEPFEPRS